MLHFCAVLQHESSSSTCVTAVLYTCYCCSIHVLLLFYTRVTVVLYTCYYCFIHVLLLFYTLVTAVLYTCYCCFIRVLLLFYTRVTAVLYTCYCHRTNCDYFMNIQVVLSSMNSADCLKSI